DGREYATDAEATIAGGAAVVAVTALVAGIAGNLGAGEQLTITQTIEGVEGSAVVTTEIAGGVDLEDLEAFRQRVLFRQRYPAQGGSDPDYIVWASTVPGVAAVWVSPKEMGSGTTTVRIAADESAGGPVPSEALRQAVEDRIEGAINPVTNQWEGRPGTAEVFIVAPTANVIDLVFERLTPNNQATLDAIAESMKAMLRDRRAPAATIRFDWINEAISKATGEDTHKLASPTDDVVCGVNEIAVLGDVTPPEE
ncbi:MAG: hypothetical protein CMM61_12940, partial [Rhodospirillaceae bacterium]|nr:hypothetical protein [Rhodospirillaceae bacterium]